MNKEKILKIIPYVVLAMGIVLTLSSFVVIQSIENQCNEHWSKQFLDYQKEKYPLQIEPYAPGVNASIEPTSILG